jgi:ferritin-like metal-binding protein YciE
MGLPCLCFETKNFNDLEDLFWAQIEDLYDAEIRLTEALPKMAEAAQAPGLKNAFQTHLRETQNHVKRLEQVFRQHGKESKRETCDGIKGLIAEEWSQLKAMRGCVTRL